MNQLTAVSQIRNFSIIAHIDHGKSTLSDRLLEITGTVASREMEEQKLDTMDLEKERGITIKLQPVRMEYTYQGADMDSAELLSSDRSKLEKMVGQKFVLNLIDTPGHVDFAYEVSRSLAACEAAILVVDATQGIQAQTLANLYAAMDQDLTIIPVLNKIDLPNADFPTRAKEIESILGYSQDNILAVSGKTGEGVPALLEAIVERIPSPKS